MIGYKHVKRKVLQQIKPVMWLGAFRVSTQRSIMYWNMMNTIILLTYAYDSRFSFIHKLLPWMNFYIFMGSMAVGLLILALVDYKIVRPSEIAYNQAENWKHRSEGRGISMIGEINTKVDNMDTRINEIGSGQELIMQEIQEFKKLLQLKEG